MLDGRWYTWLPMRGTFDSILFRYFLKVEVRLARRRGMREVVLAVLGCNLGICFSFIFLIFLLSDMFYLLLILSHAFYLFIFVIHLFFIIFTVLIILITSFIVYSYFHSICYSIFTFLYVFIPLLQFFHMNETNLIYFHNNNNNKKQHHRSLKNASFHSTYLNFINQLLI